jgi:hypothetical protein
MRGTIDRSARLAAVLTVTGLPLGLHGQVAAREDAGESGIPWTGEPAITETVAQIMARGGTASPAGPARTLHPLRLQTWPKKTNPQAPAVPCWPWMGQWPLSSGGVIDTPQTIGTNFLGAQFGDGGAGFVPPDSMGDVGPAQIVVCVNGVIRTFGKNGVPDGALNTSTNNFFNSVRNNSGTSDPTVRYDPISSRWFVTMINVSPPNRVLIAVSSGPTISNASSFSFFQFQHDLPSPSGDTGDLADYPNLGVDANALYIGDNVFNSTGTSFLSTTGFVVRKSTLLTGTLNVTAFRSLTAGGAGPFAPRGVSNNDPAATEGYFIGVDAFTFSLLQIRRISSPGAATPTISGNITLVVPTTDNPIATPCQGSAGPLSALDERLFYATIHRNRLTGVSTLWTAHNIQVNSSGVASGGGGRNGSRWYELQNMTTVPSVRQSGTLFSSAASNPINYWIPSVIMNGQGHMALGCSSAGTLQFAETASAGRLSGDVLGTIQAPTTLVTSTTSYNLQGGTQRWGDFSATVVDPADDQTIWTFQEFCNATDSWGVQVTRLLAPPPATPASAAPSSVAQGATNVNVIITGTSASGSGFYDTEPGLNRIQAAFGGAGITVNSVTFTDPTHITANISVSGAAPAVGSTVTVTNPDGQSAASAGAILTVTASCYPNCDNSTTPPILNVNDFTCFLQRYAAGDPYANCDGSTQPPVLNVNDFTCFLQSYAAGCP